MTLPVDVTRYESVMFYFRHMYDLKGAKKWSADLYEVIKIDLRHHGFFNFFYCRLVPGCRYFRKHRSDMNLTDKRIVNLVGRV